MSLGIDALAHTWLRVSYTFLPLVLIPPTMSRVREHSHVLILIAPHWTVMHWLVEMLYISAAADAALATVAAPRSAVTSGRVGLPSTPRELAAVGLAPERLNLSVSGPNSLQSNVIPTR